MDDTAPSIGWMDMENEPYLKKTLWVFKIIWEADNRSLENLVHNCNVLLFVSI